MAKRPMVTCSPVANTTSISRGSGNSWISCANATRRLVSPLMADTTTTTSCPSARARAMRLATFLMRSGLPTEVPPYFCTNKAICLNTLFTFEANPYHTWQRIGRKLGSGQFADISGRAALLPVRHKKTSLTSPRLCHYLGARQYSRQNFSLVEPTAAQRVCYNPPARIRVQEVVAFPTHTKSI